MPNNATQVDVASRLSRNLGLLQAGAPVTIDIITPAGQKGKFRSTFIGYLPKQYVLIQYPDAKKLGRFSQYIKQGAGITVRGLIEGHEGAVVAFVSSIKQTLQLPSRIIVLEFPRSVGLQSLRNSIRIDTDIAAKICVENEYWSASITDISISGCQFIVNNGESLAMSIEKLVEIVVEDFQGMTNIKLNAVICNIKTQSEGIIMGVHFDAQCKERVAKLLHHAVTLEG